MNELPIENRNRRMWMKSVNGVSVKKRRNWVWIMIWVRMMLMMGWWVDGW